MQTYFIQTFGCQMNEYDSDLIESTLMAAGYSATSKADAADVIIVNTCSVRQHAEDRATAWIREAASRKKPGAKLVLAGCMAERAGVKLKERIPGLHGVLGPGRYGRILDVIAGREKVLTGCNPTDVEEGTTARGNKTITASVAIIRGCNNYCSYCIVPYVRGPERSRPAEAVLQEAKQALSAGCKEITFLGQNVNSYRNGDMGFPQLLCHLNELPGEYRIAFMTSHPKDLSQDLIDAMAECGKVNRHLHLPAQSGSDSVLARMERGYTSRHYRTLIEKIRRAIPDIAITTDLLVGFPGESEKDFRDTLRLAEEVGYDEAYTYQYSVREGTKAAGFTDTVSEDEKKSRLAELIELQRRITKRKYQELIGQTVEVLFEKPAGRGEGQWWGKTKTGRPLVCTNPGIDPGTLANVRVTASTGATLIGELESVC